MTDNGLPLRLCDGATALVHRQPTSIAYRRGAAFVARQAIESTVRSHLAKADGPGISWRSRFLLLQELAPHTDARRGHYLWTIWSGICHYRPFEIIPDHTVIQQRIADTKAWITSTY